MPAGIQVFNADGSLQFDLDNRILRTLTSVLTGTNDGSITVSNASERQLIAVEVSPPASGVTPTTSVSGNQVAWSFGSAATGDRRSVTLQIMAY